MPHWLETVFVVFHVLAATVWVGGTVALTFIAVPAIRMLAGEPRQTAMRTLGQRWRPIGWSALLVPVATGVPLATTVLPDGGAGAMWPDGTLINCGVLGTGGPQLPVLHERHVPSWNS